ncbi:hypothetical protein [Deinococcus cavernae]|uniref:hypothetical protein n=1 Tax=Deinococcus cavernae TaxID=2320857 RepID=UPI001F44DD3B|nr:hypothetical protein [Deinococcus cavernae]
MLLTDLGLRDTLTTLAAEAKAYGKPVLLIQGDSHTLIIDHPPTEAGANTALGQTAASPVLRNVTRLQVMGEADVGAVEVTVDASTPACSPSGPSTPASSKGYEPLNWKTLNLSLIFSRIEAA